MQGLGFEKIAVIILNYNNYEDTVSCVSCFKGHEDQFELYVVDNHSTDDSGMKLQEDFRDTKHIRFIQSEVNGGYAAGNNIGIRAAIKDGLSYVCILNNDTFLNCKDLILLREFLSADSSYGVVGPVLFDYADRDIIQSAGVDIDLWRGRYLSQLVGGDESELPKEPYEVDGIVGACMMFKASLVKSIGYLPEQYFMLHEETEWCLRAKRAGFKNMCCPTARVYHRQGASLGRVDALPTYLHSRNIGLFEKRNATAFQLLVFVPFFILVKLGGSLIRRDGSAKKIGYMFDGLRGMYREPYASIALQKEE